MIITRLIILTYSLLLTILVKHDYHNSIAEVFFNPKTNNLEVTLSLFLDDYEKSLTTLNDNKNVSLKEKTDKNYTIIQNYIRRRFAIVSPKKEVITANLIDYEIEENRIVLYIEMLNCNKIKDYNFYNTILLEEFDDQTNIVNILSFGQKKTFLFNKKETIFPYPF